MRPTAYGKLKPGPGRSADDVASHQVARIHSAMVELVAERGYRAITVRELAKLAGVSSRTFYEHYAGKEQCFLRVHQLLVRRQFDRLAELADSGVDRDGRVRLMIQALLGAWEADVRATRFLLVEAHAAGSAALERARCADRSLEARIAASFASFDGIALRPHIAVGVAAGLVHTARLWLVGGEGSLVERTDRLARWACAWASAPGRSKSFEGVPTTEGLVAPFGPVPVPSSKAEGEGGVAASERGPTLVLSATAKLIAHGDLANLSPERIAAEAGVTRRAFHAEFASIEDCLGKLLEVRTDQISTCVLRSGQTGHTFEERVYRSLFTLMSCFVQDRALAELVLGEGVPADERRLDSRCRLSVGIADQVASEGVDDVALDASLGAMWGLLGDAVSRGRDRQLTDLAPTATQLLLTSLEDSLAMASTPHERHVQAVG
jgi:AcrR family transcriptional regulator